MFSTPFSVIFGQNLGCMLKDILSGAFECYAEFSATWQHGGGGPYLVWFGVRGPTTNWLRDSIHTHRMNFNLDYRKIDII